MKTALDHSRVYEYRFKDVDLIKKNAVWQEIASYIYKELKQPDVVLDPAAGLCEFINNIPAREKWAVDKSASVCASYEQNVRAINEDIFDVDLPRDYFEGIFISNFLEHLDSHEQCVRLLSRLRESLTNNGVLCIMGPNFKYCAKEYFDCADHNLIFTHLSVEEMLFSTGYKIEKSHPKFLPFSFRSRLPASPFLTKCYLNLQISWKLLGKQFLIFAVKN